MRDSIKHVTEQIEITEENLRYLDSVQTEIDNADPEDVEAIKEELINQGYLRAEQKKAPEAEADRKEPKQVQAQLRQNCFSRQEQPAKRLADPERRPTRTTTGSTSRTSPAPTLS
jgi:hypothetical protein